MDSNIELINDATSIPVRAWSVDGWSKAHTFSSSFTWKAIAGKVSGKPPLKVTRIGQRTIIMDEDGREWLRA